ncbi:nuclear transport factor 2 family protein [Nocardiopsis sp. N85]|uniref:nuclear transport factor 2 family protein n=1 Tax=Nocardiopsis sp. N85 TaxID=3029400 RepID=UPI00237F10B6|nr:nuclear transport factor 2 family protein [Nocardiopsis sp. N85]MDE3723089.1 nuclear transport factor 2 family protein [Nocardiopsis sp. N85]
MHRAEEGALDPGERIIRVGVEHVLLLYDYTDRGDVDGCLSLLDEHVGLRHPRVPTASGRTRVETVLRERLAGRGLHRVERVRAFGGMLFVTGVFAETASTRPLPYLDVFTLSEHGLVASWHRIPR